MRFSKIYSAQNHLLRAHVISIETDISRGLHSFSIVGLPTKAVEEARDRVGAAIKNSGFKSPKETNAKIIVSLAPSDLRKEGSAFDLPIALGYLLAAGEAEFDPADRLFVGELSLDGFARPVGGTLSYARMAKERGFKEIYVPKENEKEAALLEGIDVFGVEMLSELVDHLSGKKKLEPCPTVDYKKLAEKRDTSIDLDDIAGHAIAKRGLVIAAAGRHNIGLFGPPGTGKTMLARALSALMPALSFEEMLEATEIHSIAGILDAGIVAHPPVRAPHHTASYSALIGGGPMPKPGEATLAHRGILFLDEFPEFDKRAIEALRQPLEDKTISISRTRGAARFPADFILVAAQNPCPCGNRGIQGRECLCSPALVRNYEKKISGPIVDRIDMWIEVSKTEHRNLMRSRTDANETRKARELVDRARAAQSRRFGNRGIARANANIPARDLSRFASLSKEAMGIIEKASQTYGLSGRGYHRTVRLARTIADISGTEKIEAPHILEALQYRQRKTADG
ncbi:MAG TPA: YifB family Mg chelatase-like AAA ATPase [Thermodesulfobacteriota bacterium]|nr:YifB family Mg chelatase-like AAA ATPase [Candidatus Paceibacterota bacterium]HVY54138.1 YifB family Mg chelatase-like AAA ATPase [Thermodesulfobacteriota bacterium]